MADSLITELKIIIKEIKDPLQDFFLIRKSSEKILFYLIPFIIGCLYPVANILLKPSIPFNTVQFLDDLLGQLITMLTLFISFSMAYLSIIITSSSKNVDMIKETYSEKYKLKGVNITLFQILISEITYTLIVEIIFLILIFLQKFIMYISSNLVMKVYVAIDIMLLIHVLLVMMLTIKNIYFTFWKSR